ncbi:GNAT family N-acetyltransferase [Flavobacterium sp. ov086]|uniref:GNAT family N-acetyltransferase n=1 Tax=Flavobacterium sp. ov086 TaxID=1761785 RepID=UPI000B7596F2|nr:GNAT family N-acetyltransferase [Flavobacterium sp. ov086]SNR47776.1 Acetyltransferase (GNAT) domain-containing protein [Flavobacterium sp. ov086]
MKKNVSFDIVEKWLKGWSLSRELPLPVKYKSGLMVNVGYENQKSRYVFSELNDDFIQLSKSIDEPGVFLKICSSPDELKGILSTKWIIQPQGYMMFCFHQMDIPNSYLHDLYKLEFEKYNSTFVVRIVTKDGELASIGRLVLVDDLAVYDRISTETNHRRKGLATILMKELEKIALANGVRNNFLVATEEGKLFYQTLGWELYSIYTSVVK